MRFSENFCPNSIVLVVLLEMMNTDGCVPDNQAHCSGKQVKHPDESEVRRWRSASRPEIVF